MNTLFSDDSLLKKPSAFIPLLISGIAIIMVLIHAAIVGIVHETDERTLAHIFQILMVIQIPVTIYFLIKWVDKKTKQTILVVGFQATTWLTAIAAVYFLS